MASNTPSCGICHNRNVHSAAVLWCNDCDEGLCDTCNGFHAASSATKHHDTLGIDAYRKLPPKIRNLGRKCPKHDIPYTTFCRRHDTPCCKICVTKDHDTCKDVSDISDFISNVKSSVAFTELENTVKSVLQNIRDLQPRLTYNVKTLDDQKKSIEEEIQRVRKNINAHLDKIQQSLLQELDSMVISEKNNIEASKKLIHSYECKIKEFEERLTLLKNNTSELLIFLAMKQTEHDVAEVIKDMETNIGEVAGGSKIQFDKHVIESITQDVSSFGKLSIENNTRNINLLPNQTKQVQVRSLHQHQSIDDMRVTQEQTVNTGGMDVTGCLILPDNRMVFTFRKSRKVIVIKPDGSSDFEVNNQFEPYDLTFNSDMGHIIVSFLCNRIEVIGVQERKRIKTVNLKEFVGGICRYKSSVVGCGDGGIKLVDLEDGSMKTILSTDIMFLNYVEVLKDRIYFTNWKTHTVTCCNIQGQIHWSIQGEVRDPRGISVDSRENVFVVDRNKHEVVVISADGQQQRELISAEQGLDDPYSIYFDDRRSKILVANRTNAKAFLFNVTS